MGDWNSLHLIDDRKYIEEIIPDLRANGKIIDKYLDSPKYRPYHFGFYGKHDKSEIEGHDIKLKELCRKLNPQLSKYYYGSLELSGEEYSQAHMLPDSAYMLNKLMCLIIFTECAYMFPYYPIGKRTPVYLPENSLAYSAFASFFHDYDYEVFGSTIEGFGIRNILRHQDIEIILMDEKYFFEEDDDLFWKLPIYNFLKFAFDHNLGLMWGANMDSEENIYQEYSKTNPLDFSFFKSRENEGFIFPS